MTKPVCFVAMAIGRPETDAFFNRLLRPVLDRNGVKVVRIDRSQSNDDLNIQIIAQLSAADFCVADPHVPRGPPSTLRLGLPSAHPSDLHRKEGSSFASSRRSFAGALRPSNEEHNPLEVTQRTRLLQARR